MEPVPRPIAQSTQVGCAALVAVGMMLAVSDGIGNQGTGSLRRPPSIRNADPAVDNHDAGGLPDEKQRQLANGTPTSLACS